MKRKSKKLFDREFEGEKAKETKSELQEQLKQEREKFLESKKDLDPVKDKEKIEQKRNEFLKIQEVGLTQLLLALLLEELWFQQVHLLFMINH